MARLARRRPRTRACDFPQDEERRTARSASAIPGWSMRLASFPTGTTKYFGGPTDCLINGRRAKMMRIARQARVSRQRSEVLAGEPGG